MAHSFRNWCVETMRVKFFAILIPAVLFAVVYDWRVEQQRYQPRIYTLTGGKVLVARITGDPVVTRDTAAVTLYSASRKLKLSPAYISGRHLDWHQRETKPAQEWEVDYARPVAETALGLADIKDSAEVKIFYQRRNETRIAEIRHMGRYENIPQSLEKLRRYVVEKGYQLSGFYEEVYVVFEAIESDSSQWETLLRYEVAKKQNGASSTAE
jgi:hypothetical protein